MNTAENEKLIGLVMWFHDKAKNANYGFIRHVTLGDLFFHEKNIKKGLHDQPFTENDVVIFQAQESKRHQDKLDAVQVKHLDDEKNLFLLFDFLLLILSQKSAFKETDYNRVFNGVYSKFINLPHSRSNDAILQELFTRFKNHILTCIKYNVFKDEDYLIRLLKGAKNIFINEYNSIEPILIKEFSSELSYKLWVESLIELCPIDYIASIILSATLQNQKRIFERCSGADKSNVIFKLIYCLDQESKIDHVISILNLTKEHASEIYETVLNDAIQLCPLHIKLNLWLADYHDMLDFEGYKLYTITLSAADQKKFVKKVIRYIHEGKANISVEELASINIIDYETSKLVEKLDNYHLDYSTSIILNVILELKNQVTLNSKKDTSGVQRKIYDLILRQIKEPKDVLQIVDYFDNCKGRSSVSVKEEKDESGEIIERKIQYHINENNKPTLHPICDGRKAINGITQESILDEKTQVPFWWCANQKCFQPSREYHSSINWEKYTLIDFLKILKIEYKTVDLEIYLNIINKVNRFLKHMKCRECNQILYPKGKSQYAFYGVNNFICKNESCSAKEANIYLTHCLNGFCEMEIDSRDSVKCKPPEVDAENCGWYVCNYCHACCNGEQLQKRKWVHENILHQEYTCHIKGHRDLGILCCNKCGDIMESNKIDIIHYEEILNWFIEHKESKQVYKFGQNALGKWWFVIKRGKYSFEEFRKKLVHYRQSGFQIPDIDTDKDLQLISEPLKLDIGNGKILTCISCENTLDLSSDLQKTNAIKKFHKVKFAQETI